MYALIAKNVIFKILRHTWLVMRWTFRLLNETIQIKPLINHKDISFSQKSRTEAQVEILCVTTTCLKFGYQHIFVWMVRIGYIVFVIIYNPWLYFVSNTYRHIEVWKNFPWIFIPLNYDRNRTSSKSPEREKSLGSRVLQGEKRTKGKHAYKLKRTQKPNTHTGIPVTVTCSLWLTEPDAYFLQ